MKFIYATLIIMEISSIIKNITPEKHARHWLELMEQNKNNLKFLPNEAQWFINNLLYLLYFIQIALVIISIPTFMRAGLIFIPALVLCDGLYCIFRYAIICGGDIIRSCANPPGYIMGMIDCLVWLLWGICGIVL